ncbi:hypothetical protein N0V88_004529 [Collariella sp. IMI 366227]|nr:hypothetical protein N0V88_004529 [Collariella sp. IMI 366227]
MASKVNSALEPFRRDTNRTHRTWAPTYGCVQKCDFCNGRAPGILMKCVHEMACGIRICEGCVRGGAWHHEKKHFIDADALDWTVAKAPKLNRFPKTRGNRRARSPSTTSSTTSGEGPPARRRKIANDDDEFEEKETKPNQPSRFAPARNEPNLRPETRQAAARAMLDMSRQSRQFEDSDEDKREQKDTQMAEGSRGARQRRDIEERTESRYYDKCPADIIDSRERERHLERPVDHTFERAPASYHAPSPRATFSSPRPTSAQPPIRPEDRVRLVQDIYRDMYGDVPQIDLRRVRSSIPDRWEPEGPRRQYPRSTYEQYHQDVRAATAQFSRDIPPPPPGYAHYSFHNYPEDNYRTYAVEVLWDVLRAAAGEAGRWCGEVSQTVRWFVEERGREERGHEERRYFGEDRVEHGHGQRYGEPRGAYQEIRGGDERECGGERREETGRPSRERD